MLFVDNDDEPYTGWVKSETNGTLSTLGYLKKGQKQGVWMAWHPNSKMQLNGKMIKCTGFQTWHDNGKIQDWPNHGWRSRWSMEGILRKWSLEPLENKIGTLVNISFFLTVRSATNQR